MLQAGDNKHGYTIIKGIVPRDVYFLGLQIKSVLSVLAMMGLTIFGSLVLEKIICKVSVCSMKCESI
jgi:hypothetical protein